MSFKNDLEEIKELWSDASIYTRGLILLSVFLSTSSLASLADVVFKWKGFIKDAIEFYHEFVIAPLQLGFLELNWQFSIHSMNFITLYSIIMAAFIRGIATSPRSKADWFFIIVFGLSIPYQFVRLEGVTYNISTAPIIFGVIGLIVFPQLFGDDRKVKLAAYVPLAIIISAILILGAVNAGINR